MSPCLRLSLFSCSFVAAAALQATPVTFLATDGVKLHRADSTGAFFGTTVLSAAIQSLTILPSDVSLPGASAGDVIACAVNPTSGRYKIYRVANSFGTASLVEIGSLDQGVGSLTFAHGEMYGIEDSLAPIRIIKINPSTGNTITNYAPGVSVAGSGGLSFFAPDNNFYFTDGTNNRLYRWAPGGTAVLVGPIGFGFSNNGLESYGGVLYGAFRRDSPSGTMSIGTLNTSTGAFTLQATITGITGAGTGFLAVPEPSAMIGMLGGIAAFLLRRKTA